MADVVLVGDQFTISYTAPESVRANNPSKISVPMRESAQWKTSNNDLVSRDTFMKVLKNVNGVFIRTTYDENMHSTTISDVSISKAAPSNGRSFVEECSCPEGFVGSRSGLKMS